MQQQATGSFEPIRDERKSLEILEAGFINNWAGLARAFGMDPMLGRIHALAFLACEPIEPAVVQATFGLEADRALEYLRELASLGVVREGTDGTFEADGDPWSWFVGTLKERGRREFGPLLAAIRDANRRAQALRSSLPATGNAQARVERIARFTHFVDQIAGLLETFASLGAGPMLSAMRMMAKMRGPRLLRI